MLANGARRRHRRADSTQAINETAFLIYAADRRHWQQGSGAIKQRSKLLGPLNVATKDDHTAGFNLFNERARLLVEFRTRKPDEEELPYLLFDGKRVKLI